MEPTLTHRRRGLVWLVAGAASLGVGIGAAAIANAASNDSGSSSSTVVASSSGSSTSSDSGTTDTTDTSGTPATPADRPDPASLPNGPGETLLTGDTLTKVTAAAEAAEPGATVIRAETDSGGHAYEVHLKLADGSTKTLYFDESFNADGSDTGFGPAPAGQQGGPHGDHDGDGPAAPGNATTDTTASNG